MTSRIPSNASVVRQSDGAKLHAPAAQRNADVLVDLLNEHAPSSGHALEIASGTGQHVVRFAQVLPGLIWQPTEVDPARIASIDAYGAQAGLANINTAALLDASRPGWHAEHHGKDLILIVNLLHLVDDADAQTILHEAVAALTDTGCVILYGPFKRDGQLTSDGDISFDADLRAANPMIGYKNDLQMMTWLKAAGISATRQIEMPANNLAFIASKTAAPLP